MASSHLGEIIGEPVNISSLSACIARGFSDRLQIDFRDSRLATRERAEIERRCGNFQAAGEPAPAEAVPPR